MCPYRGGVPFWKTRDFEIQAESQFLFFLLEGGGGFKECSGVILTKNLDWLLKTEEGLHCVYRVQYNRFVEMNEYIEFIYLEKKNQYLQQLADYE